MSLGKIVLEFLSELETREERLLAWGLSGTEISEEELEDYAREFASRTGGLITSDELISALLDRAVLFRFRRYEHEFYRTRMAETVRLLASLRQWLWNRDWRTAPTLVADYRLSLRRRVYPKRDLPAKEFIDRLASDIQLSAQQRETLEALIGEKKLAGFQYRSTQQLLLDTRQRQTRGTIICAGTGTGKTLAFYLPALTAIVPIIESGYHWTKLIAIYPRNELLKDQMSEVFSLARSLDPITLPQRGRKLRLGCFYGDTPKSPTDDELVKRNWEKHSTGAGYICPFLRCPRCGEQLLWTFAALQSRRETLQCSSPACGLTTQPDEIVLTRDAMQAAPPDILFTSTEMLNRVISDSRFGSIFGVGATSPPRLVLLDEVHTYGGTSGAQVALLLRRWLHASKARPQFSGLSATLRDATVFFSQLTGIPTNRITEIAPGLDGPEDEMEEEGMEYRIALRGDPVSETATLSTTVQTAMLIRRVLDPWLAAPSKGAYGRRLFAFCDDLDLVNRLYNILLDAEGWDRFGRAAKTPLAALRSPANKPDSQRFLAGQSWRLCDEIGNDLGPDFRLNITRTSSQDPGVDSDSDVVVATSSLEVGVNDPEVGAVLQHKAPRDMASFLQRRGRAGRPRGMRPWTVIVLSDYGRDRTAYQAYDALFDPELQSRYLPVASRYVLRMQAVFAMMDWFASQIGNAGIPKGDIWRDFAQPAKGDYADYRRPRQQAELYVAERLLDGDIDLTASFENWLEKALQITRDELTALLWEPPRALMTEVLPTLVRRLGTNWSRIPIAPDDSKEDYVWNGNPLPDFAPPNLFTDLNLPEVRILVRQSPNGRDEEHPEPILRAMQILAPGKVTRRFATQRGFISHWIPPRDYDTPRQTIEVTAICTEFQDLGEFASVEDGQVVTRRCIRPIEMRPTIVPQRIGSTSNSFLEWRTQIFAVGTGRRFDINPSWPWGSVVREATFFLHNHHAHALVRRFAIGADAELKGQGVSSRIRLDFCEPDRRPAAVGFSQTVDGIRVRLRVPETFQVAANDPDQDKVRAFRTAYYRHRIHQSPMLASDANRFIRDRLCDVYLSSMLAHAMKNRCSLADSNAFIQTAAAGREEPAKVLDGIFRTLDTDFEPDDTEEGGDQEKQLGKMHKRLLDHLADDRLFAALGAEAPVLWEQPGPEWQEWARERLVSTVGRALLDACNRLCPQFDGKDLFLDLEAGPQPPGTPPLAPAECDIWITESTMGGAGIVEEVFRQYAANPRRFFEIALAALEPSDFEEVDASLRAFIKSLNADEEARELIVETRAADGLEQNSRAVEKLRDLLLRRGYTPHHALLTSLHSRLLRPGSSMDTDELLRRLVTLLEDQEVRVGVEMDMRVFAYVASLDPDIQQAFDSIPEFEGGQANWRCSVIYGLLWPHGNAIRSRGLYYPHPFSEQPPADAQLLQDLLLDPADVVKVSDANWKDSLAARLNDVGSCRLVSALAERERLSAALLELAVSPVEMGALLLYPSVGRIRQDGSRIEVSVRLKGAV